MMNPESKSSAPASGWRAFWKFFLLILIVLVLAVLYRYFELDRLLREALTWIEDAGPIGPAVFFILYVAACILMVPGSILTLGAGAVFGVVYGSLLVSVSSTVGATAAFLVGRYLVRDLVTRRLSDHPAFAAVDRAVAAEGWKIVGLTRLSPLFPFNFLNYAYGLTRVSLKHYLPASWIGMMPGTVMYVYIGSLAGSLATLGGGDRARDRSPWEWGLYLLGLTATVAVTILITRLARRALKERLSVSDQGLEADPGQSVTPSRVSPLDDHNRKLLDQVRPAGWAEPVPEPVYNLVVIGAGTAGLISALGCAGLGGKAALVERNMMGGDCLNVGCVPSKALLRSSRAAAEAAFAGAFGLTPHAPDPADFENVMKRLRRLRAQISRHDAAARYRDLGVHVYLGEASFTGPHTIAVGDTVLKFRKAVIATGARAAIPDIPGLESAGYLTNETIFNLTSLPRRLVVIGGGPIGCELAQGFRRLGAEVTVIHRKRLLPREDPEASAVLAQVFQREGIRLLLEVEPLSVENHQGQKRLTVRTRAGEAVIEADAILIAAGRRPNVEGLDLENAGVAYDLRQGIPVDDFLRTTNPDIFGAGDICLNWKFTHAADASARIAVQNALFRGRKRVSALNMSWCTYTDPEIAHVGLYEAEARRQGIEPQVFRVGLEDVDRAVLDGQTDGLVKIIVKKGTDRILGATIVAAHAGDLISEISVAMAGHVGLKTLAGVIHPYPTHAEVIRRAADAYNRTRLTPRVAALLKWWLKRQRGR